MVLCHFYNKQRLLWLAKLSFKSSNYMDNSWHDSNGIKTSICLSPLPISYIFSEIRSYGEYQKGQDCTSLYHQHLLRTVPTLTPRAGRRPAEVSWPRWAPWIRWRWTNSLAEGSVQKWSDVFSLVYSRAQGPTENTAHARADPLTDRKLNQSSTETFWKCATYLKLI